MILVNIVLLALALFFVVNIVRTVAPESWRAKKPLSCNVCMSFWTTALIAVLAYFFVRDGIVFAKYGACVAGGVLVLLRAFPSAPPRPSLRLDSDP